MVGPSLEHRGSGGELTSEHLAQFEDATPRLECGGNVAGRFDTTRHQQLNGEPDTEEAEPIEQASAHLRIERRRGVEVRETLRREEQLR